MLEKMEYNNTLQIGQMIPKWQFPEGTHLPKEGETSGSPIIFERQGQKYHITVKNTDGNRFIVVGAKEILKD